MTAKGNAAKSSYQVCYDVMVTFYMFPHTDSLERKTERKRERKHNLFAIYWQYM